MTRIAILGDGFIGRRLRAALPHAMILPIDVTDPSALQRALSEAQCDVVVNTAAKTGRPNVDWCESHRSETFRANVVGALTVADVCAELGLFLVHLGSACVFFGASPEAGGWSEGDFANPRSFYTRTKYAAELVLDSLPRVAIVRVRLLIDSVPHPRNFVTKLAGYRSVVDVTNSATIVDDLVRAIDAIIAQRASGVFHAVNPGLISNQHLLERYRELVDWGHAYELVSEAELYARGLALAPRSNCRVASARLEQLGIRFDPIDAALERVLHEYGRSWRSAPTLRA